MYIENIDDINVELEQVATMGLDIKESGPPGEKGEPGLSAYEIYLKNGGTLSETEWLESLKGDTGVSGIYVGDDEPTDENINIWLDTNGISEPTTMTVENNTLIVKPTITTKVEGGMLIL